MDNIFYDDSDMDALSLCDFFTSYCDYRRSSHIHTVAEGCTSFEAVAMDTCPAGFVVSRWYFVNTSQWSSLAWKDRSTRRFSVDVYVHSLENVT